MTSVEKFEEDICGHWHSAKHPHELFAFLLFLKQLTFSADVTSVALSSHVLAHGLDVLSCEDFATDLGLYSNLEQLLG